MMKRVRSIDGYALYELATRDLNRLVDHDYQAGNILIYRLPEKARLGRELGRASDLVTAEKFLASLAASPSVFPLEGRTAADTFTIDSLTAGSPAVDSSAVDPLAATSLATDYAQALREKDQALLELKTHYETLRASELEAHNEAIRQLEDSVDALKGDLAEKDARITQLSLATLQGDLQREELMSELIESASQSPALSVMDELDELRAHSVGTQNELRALQAAYADLEGTNVVLLAEKNTLEIELNTALKNNAAAQRTGAGVDVGAAGAGVQNAGSPFTQSSDDNKELVLTNESGNTIHIYHEFPTPPQRSPQSRLLTQSGYIGLILAIIAAAAYIAYLNSLLGAIQSSGVDIQPYSEALIERIRTLLPFNN
jgi:hypothetical protein